MAGADRTRERAGVILGKIGTGGTKRAAVSGAGVNQATAIADSGLSPTGVGPGDGRRLGRLSPGTLLDAGNTAASILTCREAGPVGGNTRGNRSLIAQW